MGKAGEEAVKTKEERRFRRKRTERGGRGRKDKMEKERHSLNVCTV